LPHQRWLNKVSILLAGDDVPSTVAAIQKTWEKLVPDKPFEYFFLDEYYHSLYTSEQTTASLLLIFSSMALIISVLGCKK
jgi:putative ABC transport system permease protein